MEEQSNAVHDDGPFENFDDSDVASREIPADLDEFASYEDGDARVICDRANAKAWIRSDVVTTLSR